LGFRGYAAVKSIAHVVGDGILAAHAPVEEIGDGEAVVDLVAGAGVFAEDKLAAIVSGDFGDVLLAIEAGEHAQAPAEVAEGVRAAVLLGAVGEEVGDGGGNEQLANRFAVVGDEVFDGEGKL